MLDRKNLLHGNAGDFFRLSFCKPDFNQGGNRIPTEHTFRTNNITLLLQKPYADDTGSQHGLHSARLG